MSDFAHDTQAMTATEFARRIGIARGSLRAYERLGLLSPPRTPRGWRLYGMAEVSRILEILALKRMGMDVANIAEILGGSPADLDRALAMQESSLTAQCERISAVLLLIEAARANLSKEGTVAKIL